MTINNQAEEKVMATKSKSTKRAPRRKCKGCGARRVVNAKGVCKACAGRRERVDAAKAKAKKEVEATVSSNGRRTISSVARQLICDGKTNKQVMDALVKEFDVDPETKSHYPSWYRAEVVRKGLMSKAAARANAN